MQESIIDFPKAGLCPEVWDKVVDDITGLKDTWKLNKQVKDRIMFIMQKFKAEYLLLPDDVIYHITGSITSNQYTENSDIDLHFHSDSLQFNSNDEVDELNQRLRAAYVQEFIGKHPIEIYYQDNKFQDYMSVGCYNVLDDIWEVGPELADSNFNPYAEYYEEAKKQSEAMASQIRNKILSVYETAIAFKKNLNTEFGKNLREVLLEQLSNVQDLYDSIRKSRKIYSSPTSKEEALKFRATRKWHIADTAFKLFDKYGYLAILKAFIQIFDIMSSSELTDIEACDNIVKEVRDYIGNADKLMDSEFYESIKVFDIEKCRQRLAMLFESHEKSLNEFGEEQISLGENDQAYNDFNDIVKQCKTKSFFKSKDGKETDMSQLKLDSLAKVNGEHYVATVYGGENGWGRFESYLDTVKKLVSLTSKKFSNPWLVDWKNDCADDVWTLRIGFSDKSSRLNESVGKTSSTPQYDRVYNKIVKMIYQSNDLKFGAKNKLNRGNKCILLWYGDVKKNRFGFDDYSNCDCAWDKNKSWGLVEVQTFPNHQDLTKQQADEAIEKAKFFITKHTLSQVNEGIKETISSGLLAALLAIPGILPAKTVQQSIKTQPTYSYIVNDINAKCKKIGEYTSFQAANIIARTLFAEARNDGEVGMRAVASVIYNRADKNIEDFVNVCKKNGYSKKAKRIVHQFSCWNKMTDVEWSPKYFKVKLPKAVKINSKEQKLWEKAMEITSEMLSKTFVPTTKATMYYNDKTSSPDWGKQLTSVEYIGSHKFGVLKNHSPFK